MRSIVTIILAASALSSPALAQTAAAAPNEFAALAVCLQQLDGQLRAKRSTPERYQLALSGSCLDEEEAVLKEVRRFYDAMPHPGISYQDAQEISGQSMANLRQRLSQMRVRNVGSYTAWFELSSPSN
jgi:hypothetical protein